MTAHTSLLKPRNLTSGLSKKLLAAALAATYSLSSLANNLQTGPLVQNTDFALFGVSGLRGTGTGIVTVSGVSGTVTRAILLWHGITNTTTPLSPNGSITGTSSATALIGSIIGQSDNNCWGATESQAFRTELASGVIPGNGTYTLSNFRNAPQFDPNGASLLVFFDDGNAANNRDIAVFWGNDSNVPNVYDALGWSATLSGINYSGGAANATLIVSDGQSFGVSGQPLNINSGSVPLPAFSGNTLPLAPGSTVTDGGLWDHHTISVTSFLTPGPNVLALSAPIVEPPTTPTSRDADCVSLISTVFDFPVGSISNPTQATAQQVPAVPAVGLGAMLLAFIAALGFGLRRREKKA
jgi:hypothetical protein